ncbi:MAG TPA: ABC transporter permease [Streptosporangiaceae bacterium]|jgi:peptide/nickel transport system permease protein|nr:ABC transporter permease [Streptosporangiaceae bacterium]
MALSTSTGLGTVPAADDGAGAAGAGRAAPRHGRRPRLRLPRSPKVLIGVALILGFLVVAIFGSTLAPYDPSRTFSLTESFPLPPSAHHLLGTTQQQQDVLSQLLVGTRSTVLVAFIAGMIATILSVVIGVAAGYQGRLADDVLSMVANFFLVLPALPLLIVIFGFLKTNQGGHDVLIGAIIALTGWAWGARVLRAQTLSLRNRDYVDAARISGERSWRIITFEILPNLVPIVAASFLFTVLYAVGTYTALAFLGLVNPNHWSWGGELFYAQVAGGVTSGYWWLFIPPGLAVALLGTALALVNFGIDEFVNPRLRVAGVSRRAARRSGGAKLPRRFVLGVTPVARQEVPATTGGAPPGQRPTADLITTDHGKARRGQRGSGQRGSGQTRSGL